MTKLLGFYFEIQYRPKLENKAADALSRVEPTVSSLAISSSRVLQLDDVRLAVASDEELSKVIASIQTGEEKPGYSVLEGVLLYKGRLVVPKSSPLTEIIL